MAESFGGWSNNQLVWFQYSVGSVSQSTTSVTVAVNAYLRIGPNGSAVGTWYQSWSGYWGSGGQNISINSPLYQTTDHLIRSWSTTVSLTDSTQTLSFGATGQSFLGSVSHSFSLSVPARYALTPTNLAVARVSDTQHTLSWTRNSTYTSVVVQRATNDGSWVEVGRPTGNPASFTDTSTVANRKYAYRVAGVGGSGQSGWSSTVTVYTTPAPPSSVSAEKVGSDIVVSATGLPAYATSYNVEDNGVEVGTGVSLPWTHVAPNAAVTHTYRVRSVRGSLVSGLSSASNTVQLLTAPNAPSGLAPNGSLGASDTAVVFSWTHNPVDTTSQSAYELQYRLSGGAWTTLSGTTASTRSVTLDVGTFEWQVRTKGAHPDWSPWSAVATVEVITRPGVAVNNAGSQGEPVMVAVWTFNQVQGKPQSSWTAELLDGSTVVESASGSGTVTSHTFAYRLLDNTSYTVRVTAGAGGVLSAPGVQSVFVRFSPPAPPAVSGGWVDEVGGVSLSVADRAEDAIPDVVNLATNPSFESGSGVVTVRTNLITVPNLSASTTGWSFNFVTSSVASGGRQFTPTANLGAATDIATRAQTDMAVTAGETVSGGFRITNLTDHALPFQPYFRFGGSGTNTYSSVQNIPAGETVIVSVSATVPAGDTTAGLRLRPGALGILSGDSFVIGDDITVVRAPSVGALFSGSTPASGDFTYAWSGTAHASTSLMRGVGVDSVALLTGRVAYLSSEWASTGTKSLRIAPRNDSSSNTDSFASIGGDAPGVRMGMEPGKSYTAKAKLRLAAPLTGTLFGYALRIVVFTRVGEASYVITSSAQAPNAAGVHDVSLTFTVPVGATEAFIRLYNGASAGNGDVWWDDLIIVEGTYTGPYFDGNTRWVEINGTQLVTEWDGTPNASTSTATMPPPAETINLERSLDGETWEPILEGAETSVTLQDWESRSNGSTFYRATAYAATGAANETTIEVVADSGDIWLSGGVGYSEAAKLPYSPQVSIRAARERTTHRYKGRTIPVAYAGENANRVIQVSGIIPEGETGAGVDQLADLAMSEEPVHLYRDPDGRRIYGALSDVQLPREQHRLWGYSFTLEETDR